MASAASLKAEGNDRFSAGEFLKAVGSFSKALKLAEGPEAAAILCNRCAALLQLTKLPKVHVN